MPHDVFPDASLPCKIGLDCAAKSHVVQKGEFDRSSSVSTDKVPGRRRRFFILGVAVGIGEINGYKYRYQLCTVQWHTR